MARRRKVDPREEMHRLLLSKLEEGLEQALQTPRSAGSAAAIAKQIEKHRLALIEIEERRQAEADKRRASAEEAQDVAAMLSAFREELAQLPDALVVQLRMACEDRLARVPHLEAVG